MIAAWTAINGNYDPQDCLHCKINRLMDEHAKRKHLETGERVNVDDQIDDLIACTAELIAFYGDAKTRKLVAKREAQKLVGRVRHFREISRYPGGPGQGEIKPNHLL